MQERAPSRPAPDFSEVIISKTPEEERLPFTLSQHYLAFLKCQQGRLCTIEDLLDFHQGLKGEIVPYSYLRNQLKTLRKRLPEGTRIVTLGSGGEGRMYGVVFLPQGQEITSFSGIGVSVFEDESGKLKVIPGLSLLSQKGLEQNPLVKPGVVIFLFDALAKENKRRLQTPFLSPLQRRLLAFLIKHPEGVSARQLLIDGFGENFITQDKLNFLKDLRRHCREKMRNSGLAIYYATPGLSGEETRYFLMNKQKVGKKVQVPIVKEEELSFLPEEVRGVVDNLCNRLTVLKGGKLRSLLTPTQRRLLLYLARNFGTPCLKEELASLNFKAIGEAKSGLQKTLEERDLSIFTLLVDRRAAYVLLPRNHFQGGKKGELPIVSRQDLAGVNEKIRPFIQKMCNQVKVKGLRLSPLLGGKKREILLELAIRFPQGCRPKLLEKKLFLDTVSPEKSLRFYINQLRRMISEELGDKSLKIKYIFGEYRFQVPSGEQD